MKLNSIKQRFWISIAVSLTISQELFAICEPTSTSANCADQYEIMADVGDEVILSGGARQRLTGLQQPNGYSSSFAPTISQDGTLFFRGVTDDLISTKRNVIVKIAPDGTKSVLAQSGVDLGTGQPPFWFFDMPLVNSVGDLFMRSAYQLGGTVDSTNSSSFQYRSSTASQFLQVFRSGQPAPSPVVGNFTTSAPSYIQKSNDAEDWITLKTGIGTTGANGVVFRIEDQSVAFVAGANQFASGLEALGLRYYLIDAVTNDYGDVLNYGTLSGNGVSVDNNQGLWVKLGRQAQRLIYRSGTDLGSEIDGPGGVPSYFVSVYNSAAIPVITRDRKIVFSANTKTRANITQTLTSNGGGIWMVDANGSNLVPIVRTGDPAPEMGLGSCQLFPSRPSTVAGNLFYASDNGDVFFWASVSGAGCLQNYHHGLFVSEVNGFGDRAVRLVYRSDQQISYKGIGYTIHGAATGLKVKVGHDGLLTAWVGLMGGTTGGIEYGMIHWKSGTLKVAYKAGDSVPRLPGVTITAIGSIPDLWSINGNDEILVRSQGLRADGYQATPFLYINDKGEMRGVLSFGDTVTANLGLNRLEGSFYHDGTFTDNRQFAIQAVRVQDGVGKVSLIKISVTNFDIQSECRADANQDGVVGTEDVFSFLDSWFAREFRADFNGDGHFGPQDIFDFLNAYQAGC